MMRAISSRSSIALMALATRAGLRTASTPHSMAATAPLRRRMQAPTWLSRASSRYVFTSLPVALRIGSGLGSSRPMKAKSSASMRVTTGPLVRPRRV
jgi:hypothetical protein